jgi:hypothetical protein
VHPPILRALPKLQYLSLAYNAITDSGLAFLEGCPKFQSLTLSFNKITDFGLVYLEGLPKLQSLDLSFNFQPNHRLRPGAPQRTYRTKEFRSPLYLDQRLRSGQSPWVDGTSVPEPLWH